MVEVTVIKNQVLTTNRIFFHNLDEAQIWVDEQKAKNVWPFNEQDHKVLIRTFDDLPRQWAELRAERNKRLSACDWAMLIDSPLTSEKVSEWKVYRQALRDLPYNTHEPSLVEWPNEPE